MMMFLVGFLGFVLGVTAMFWVMGSAVPGPPGWGG